MLSSFSVERLMNTLFDFIFFTYVSANGSRSAAHIESMSRQSTQSNQPLKEVEDEVEIPTTLAIIQGTV